MRDRQNGSLPPNLLAYPPPESSRLGSFIPPVLLTPVFGRQNDLRAVCSLLDREQVRLVTLTGPPGVGKTRLALVLSDEWQTTTGNEAFYVPLSFVSDASLVLPTIAYGLNVQPKGDIPLAERIAATLRGRPALLVLDNFEQVIAAAADLVELLTRCPLLTILVTSRAALRVRGEYEWQVLPLIVPPSAHELNLPALRANPAIALFLDRAQAAQPQFALTRLNAPSIAAICARLEGIPLAIELAVPWLKLFSPEMLLERLSRDLALLRDGSRDLPPRQRTLTDAIAWSDNLLDPEQRRLFHLLAVFTDGWSLTAAEAVYDLDGSSTDDHLLLDGLSSLRDRSLIQRDTAPDGTPRFWMFKMVRSYALARLLTSGTAGAVMDRHAAYYLAYVEEAAPHLYGSDQALWLERMETELGNLRSALRWLIDQGEKNRALRMGAQLENFWLVHDHLGEGQRWLEEALALDDQASLFVEAEARRALATLMLRLGDYLRAGRLYRANLSFSREQGDDALERQTLLDLGSLYFISGYLEQATDQFEAVLELGRAAGDRRTVARALNQLGEIARFVGDDAAAVGQYQQSLTVWRELAENERVAMVLHNLAPVVARAADRLEAAELFAESLTISRELRNTHGAALCLSGIAGLASDNRAHAMQATQILGAAEALRASIGVQWQPVDRAEFDRSLAIVRSQLDEETFAAAWAVGWGLSLEHAMQVAAELLDALKRGWRRPGPRRNRVQRSPGGLSRREYEVVTQIALGRTNREIAEALSVAEKTIEMHVSHSLSKLRVRSRAQLAAWIASEPPSNYQKRQNTG